MKIEKLWVVLATNRHFDNPPKCWQDLVYHAVPSELFGQGSLRPEEIYAVYTDQDEANADAKELWDMTCAKDDPAKLLQIINDFCKRELDNSKKNIKAEEDEECRQYYLGQENAFAIVIEKIRLLKRIPT